MRGPGLSAPELAQQVLQGLGGCRGQEREAMLGDGAGAVDAAGLGWVQTGSRFAHTNSYICLALSLHAVYPQTGKTEEFP